MADDPADDVQVQLVRSHLQSEAEAFARGDFGDPARIHGEDMPGLATLETNAGSIDVAHQVREGRAPRSASRPPIPLSRQRCTTGSRPRPPTTAATRADHDTSGVADRHLCSATGSQGGMMRGFGELEGAIMQELWNAPGGATVREVFEQLSTGRIIAYTTVMSTIHNLYRKGRLTREPEGKAHRYHPTATRAEYSAEVMREALVEGGDSVAILSRFVERMSVEDAQQLQDLLRRQSENREP